MVTILALAVCSLMTLGLNTEPTVFSRYLESPYPPANGFDPCREGTPRALANGHVAQVTQDFMVVDTFFYENHVRREARITYTGLRPRRHKGVVVRGQVLGKRNKSVRCAQSVALEADGVAVLNLEEFVSGHGSLFVPQDEGVLVLIDTQSYHLVVYDQQGGSGLRRVSHYAVALGQAHGIKDHLGDRKTPRGMYFVVAKSQGPFQGSCATFCGGVWVKLNYPNAFDAARGVEEQLISPEAASNIRTRWAARRLTQQDTPLGGGIGLHGWVAPWDPGPNNVNADLSWGCVVLQPKDAHTFYGQVPIGTMVVIM